MTTLNYSTALYYRHSGRVPAQGLLMTLLAGIAVAIPLGAAYAYIDLYNPIAGYVTFLVTGGTGYVLGLVLSKTLVAGKVRNVPMASTLALVVAGVMYVAAWEFWLYAFVQRDGGLNLSFSDIVLHPGLAWELMVQINEVGAWSISGGTPTGIILDLIWAGEAALLVGIPIWLARRAVTNLPFCETCNKWCAEQPIIRLKAGDKKAIRDKLEGRDFGVLGALGQAAPSARSFWSVYLQGCAGCDATQTLCIDEIVITTDNKGKAQINKKPVISRLILTPEDTVTVATAAAMLKAPPQPKVPPLQPPPGAAA